MRRLKIILAVMPLFVCSQACAAEVSICNQSRFFLEVTEGGELLAEAAAGECFTLQIREKEKWLINFGMTRYLFDFTHLGNCLREDRGSLVATDEGKLYCGAIDREQPKGFPLEVLRKIDLI